MYKIIINTSQDGTILVRHNGQYSILKSSIIELHSGENILDDLKYGFYLEYSLFHSNGVISIDLSNFDVSNVNLCRNMFYGCYKLKHIKCKRSFKKWCFHNMNFISLPYSMIDGGCGIWEIID